MDQFGVQSHTISSYPVEQFYHRASRDRQHTEASQLVRSRTSLQQQMQWFE
jgi:hypothetical protein